MTFLDLCFQQKNFFPVLIPDFVESFIGKEQVNKNIKIVQEKIKNNKIIFHTWDHTGFLVYPNYKFAGFENILGEYYNSNNWIITTSCKNNFFKNHFQNFDNFLQFIQLGSASDFHLINHNNKTRDFLFLNGKAHPHRIELAKEMIKHRLLDNSVWSFNDDNVAHTKIEEQYEWPIYRNNIFDGYSDFSRMVYPPQYNDTRCSIIAETLDDDNIPFISEKTAKAIMAGHIFVILSGRHFLKSLHDLGFKTFSSVFDESYDEAETRSGRIYRIINTLKYIKECDTTKLYNDTKEIREHNRRLIMNTNMFSNLNLQEFELAKEYLARY